jgi:hypothetical protein
MHYETATSFGLNSGRSKPIKKQRKRGSLSTAIDNQLAVIARKGSASKLERQAIDNATDAIIAAAKMQRARG